MVTVEVSRTHLPAGDPAPLTTVHEVWPEKRGQTMPDAVMNVIRSFNPSRTSQNCVYLFDSPEHGKGRITVAMRGAIYRELMDEKVQMLELERVLGCREPAKVDDSMIWMYAIRLEARNPYMQILLGALVIWAGILGASLFFVHPEWSYFDRIGLSIVGVVVIAVGVMLLLYPGARRFRWWHRARAEVKRRGDKMPSALQLFP